LIERIGLCNHWSGEEPYDPERKAEILSAITDLKCEKLEVDEAAVLKRHAKKPAVKAALEKAKETFY
jgi:hypothetical protein